MAITFAHGTGGATHRRFKRQHSVNEGKNDGKTEITMMEIATATMTLITTLKRDQDDLDDIHRSKIISMRRRWKWWDFLQKQRSNDNDDDPGDENDAVERCNDDANDRDDRAAVRRRRRMIASMMIIAMSMTTGTNATR